MKTPTALILGGNRFFGRHLASELVTRGIDVTLLNRGRIDDGLGRKVSRLVADRSNPEQLAAVLGEKTWDFVFDQICFNGRDAASLAKVLKGKTERLIFTSTQSVYGMGFGLSESDFDPTTYVAPDPREESYQALKREAEATYATLLEFRIAMVRIPIILGLDDYTGRLKWHIDRAMQGLSIHIPNPSARLGFLRSDFAGRLIAELGLTNFTGPINLACPGEIAVRDILKTVEESTGRPIRAGTETSPFGADEDWTMDLAKMKSLGLTAPELSSWFPNLVRELTEVSRKNLDAG